MPDTVKDRLSEIEARIAAATPGPWIHELEDGEPTEWVILRTGDEIAMARDGAHDAHFIAHARTDLPDLAKLVREQQQEISSLKLRLEAAERDTARLDFLAQSIEIECLMDGPQVEAFAVGDQIMDDEFYPTLRAAIDAARQEPSNGPLETVIAKVAKAIAILRGEA